MKVRYFSLIFITIFLLTGCTPVFGVESYLKPPKLSEQHEQIYSALINAEGSKISLKYPKSGTYLSAFVVADIDDEPTEEAIVFYEKASFSGSDTSTLRINFLDQKNGKWESVYDFSAEGNEIERVFISDLGSSKRKNVIVGIGTPTEKSAQMFFYDESMSEAQQSLGYYSVMDVCDINNDGSNELLMINNTPSGNTAQLKWLDEQNTLISGPELSLTDSPNDIAQLIYSKTNNSTAVYVDFFTSTNTIMTEILCSETDEDTVYLKYADIQNLENEAINKTIRQSSLLSKDIDNDGIVEIPINTIFKGYEDKLDTEQIFMTNWYAYEDNMLMKKYSSYYSINDGYAFIFPSRWNNTVTAEIINDDIVFLRYDENSDKQTELLKICVVNSDEAEDIQNENNYKYYETIYSNGDTIYLGCIPDTSNDPLALTPGEISLCFLLAQ